MSEIPAHCPYKAGDRVQMHGYTGHHVHRGQHLNDHEVIGFRGTVEGYLGGTILTGRADDGRRWAQEWGHLDPDLTPCDPYNRCGCCPHPGRKVVNGHLIAGRCQPDQADPDRAARAAQEHADWWRTPAHLRPVTSTVPTYDQGALFEEMTADA